MIAIDKIYSDKLAKLMGRITAYFLLLFMVIYVREGTYNVYSLIAGISGVSLFVRIIFLLVQKKDSQNLDKIFDRFRDSLYLLGVLGYLWLLGAVISPVISAMWIIYALAGLIFAAFLVSLFSKAKTARDS